MTAAAAPSRRPSRDRVRPARRGASRQVPASPTLAPRRAFAATPNGLDAPTIAGLRARLADQRDFRAEQVRELVPLVRSRDGDAAHLEVRRILLAGAQQALAEVRAALWSIDEGCYGTCRTCGSALDRQRLLSVPSTTCCAGCR